MSFVSVDCFKNEIVYFVNRNGCITAFPQLPLIKYSVSLFTDADQRQFLQIRIRLASFSLTARRLPSGMV